MSGDFATALLTLEPPLTSINLMLFLLARLVSMLSSVQRPVQQILNILPAVVDRVEAMTRDLEAESEASDDPALPTQAL